MSWARYCYFWLDATHGRFKIRFLPSGEMSGGKLGSLHSICLQQRGAVTDSPYHKGLVGISDQTAMTTIRIVGPTDSSSCLECDR